MTAFYKLRQFPKNPKVSLEEKQWFGVAYSPAIASLDELAERVARRSGHSKGQVIGLIEDYFSRIERHVLSGRSVSMKPLGIIAPYISSSGAECADDCGVDSVRKVNIRLRTGEESLHRIQTRLCGGELDLKKFGE